MWAALCLLVDCASPGLHSLFLLPVGWSLTAMMSFIAAKAKASWRANAAAKAAQSVVRAQQAAAAEEQEDVAAPDGDDELSEAERKKLTGVTELCEVPLTQASKGSFGVKDAEQDLQRLLGKEELHGRCFECPQKLALSACCGLLKYLQLMGCTESHGQWIERRID